MQGVSIKEPFPQKEKRFYSRPCHAQPVSLRRYCPDQVDKGCPFLDSQMLHNTPNECFNTKGKSTVLSSGFFRLTALQKSRICI